MKKMDVSIKTPEPTTFDLPEPSKKRCIWISG